MSGTGGQCLKKSQRAFVCAGHRLAVVVLVLLFCLDGSEAMGQDRIQRLQLTAAGFPEAVIVQGDTCWTGQVQPAGALGGTAAEQAVACLRELERILRASGGSLGDVARLHLYAESDEILAAARQVLQSQWSADARPALTQVVSDIPGPGLLTMDVIATASESGVRRVTTEWSRLPAGRQIHVAGQAEQSESVYEASFATLQSLQKTLEFLGRDAADIVQLKAFVQPASAAGDVQRAVQQFFGPDRPQPALVIVEWKSGAKVPVEIELVAAGGPVQADQPAIVWVTPPGMTKSPVYSRVCVVQTGALILTSGITAAEQRREQSAEAAARESAAVLENLRRIVLSAGGDFQNLVKATYYVSSDSASSSLNTVRPRFYDPERPPAASKAIVSGTGVPAAELAMDLIAVPAEKPVR
ncbi:MAG: Rid family hydrolase [Planctomycetaceae bacterium]